MGKVWAIHTQTKKPKKQKTKKPKKQKNKKPKKTKKQDCTPQGEGVRCRVLGLVFLFFLFFFVFLFFCFFVFFWFFGLCVDSHCRCANQRLPGTVSGCTRSKVDTLQYSNVCYDIVHSANEQQRGMEFNFVRLRHMLLDLCPGNAAICALPQWPVLFIFGRTFPSCSEATNRPNDHPTTMAKHRAKKTGGKLRSEISVSDTSDFLKLSLISYHIVSNHIIPISYLYIIYIYA